MKEQDGLTVINSQPLIAPEKIQDKTLDQMTLPERSELLREAYTLIGDDSASEDELEVISTMNMALDEKVASWGLIISKVQNADDLCMVEADYFQQKANAAKERAQRYRNKAAGMSRFLKAKMIEFNKKKIETPLVTVSLRKRPQKVESIGDPSIESPEHPDFIQTTISRQWDKKAIKAKLDEGQLFKSFKLSEPDFNISIKGT